MPAGPFERFEIAGGGWFSSAVGLAVRLEGTSHDSFEGGGWDLVAQLTLWDATGSTRWLPSLRGTPALVEARGRCVRLLDGGAGRVTLEIAPATAAGMPSRSAPSLPPCAPPAVGVEPLADYADAKDGAHYHLVVERHPIDGEWRPAPQPRFIHGVGARLAWSNLGAYPGLASAQRERLRFTFELLSRSTHAFPSRHRSLVTYFTRVTEICKPGIHHAGGSNDHASAQ